MKELICIVCPKGCHLHVDEENDYAVTGNGCFRGAEYGHKELTHPTRTLTSTIKIKNGTISRVSVKTSKDVDKALLIPIMKELNHIEVQAPVHRGDVVVENICQSGANLVITHDIFVK